MRRLLLLLGLLTTWLPGCSDPYEPEEPVDSTAYLEVADAIRDIRGDSAADEFLATADPALVFFIDDTVEITGSTDIKLNGESLYQGPIPNQALEGMGQTLAYALRYGTCGQISGMTATFYALSQPPQDFAMSTPVRTAGGRGANDYVTVQSTYTVAGDNAFLSANKLYIQNKVIAWQDGNNTLVPLGDTLQVDWTINCSVGLCPYQTAIRNDLMQGINPEAAWGGSVYALNLGQWVFDVGNSGMMPRFAVEGGTGSVSYLFLEFRYTHSGATRIVQEFEVYNSNSNLASERTGMGISLADGKTMRGYHRVTFVSGG